MHAPIGAFVSKDVSLGVCYKRRYFFIKDDANERRVAYRILSKYVFLHLTKVSFSYEISLKLFECEATSTENFVRLSIKCIFITDLSPNSVPYFIPYFIRCHPFLLGQKA